jgi:hypothetical protein
VKSNPTRLWRYGETQSGPQRLAAYLLRLLLHLLVNRAGPQFSSGQWSGDGNGGTSAVRTPEERSLYYKLLSFESFMWDLAEIRHVADEKQKRAEWLHNGLVAELRAELEKVLTWCAGFTVSNQFSTRIHIRVLAADALDYTQTECCLTASLKKVCGKEGIEYCCVCTRALCKKSRNEHEMCSRLAKMCNTEDV